MSDKMSKDFVEILSVLFIPSQNEIAAGSLPAQAGNFELNYFPYNLRSPNFDL